ncbi:MAG: CapA family protein, partial [Patescibacteria group bacterium]
MRPWDYPVFQPKNFLAGVVLGVVIMGMGYIMWNQSNKIDYVAATPMPTPTPSPESNQISMILVGDIMLSRQVGEKIAASGDWRYPFLRIKDFLESADLAVANLENPVSNRGIRVGSVYSFRADPRTLAGLKYAGIDIVSLANNHIWDYGREAFLDTMMHLTDRGIFYIGAGRDATEAHAGVTMTVKGTSITFLGYTDLLSRQLNATAISIRSSDFSTN